MKLATYYSKQGHEIIFIDMSSNKFDLVFASKIFIGGSGYDLKSKLPDDIEELVPDYERFRMDKSIIFTQRGCIRNCDFCIVRKKEGIFKDIPEKVWHKQIKHKNVIVWDNNFLASKEWKKKLRYFQKYKFKVCFNQGLDIRLVTKENAKELYRTKCFCLNFKTKGLYFAIDSPKILEQADRGINLLIEAGFKLQQLMFYVLVGFDTTLEEDLERIEYIIRKGCKPFVMIYNHRKDIFELIKLAKWCNRRYYKICSFNEFDYYNINKHRKNKEK
jgi:radical SAM superfamily enzyme YgiQ (UPF0313 family)